MWNHLPTEMEQGNSTPKTRLISLMYNSVSYPSWQWWLPQGATVPNYQPASHRRFQSCQEDEPVCELRAFAPEQLLLSPARSLLHAMSKHTRSCGTCSPELPPANWAAEAICSLIFTLKWDPTTKLYIKLQSRNTPGWKLDPIAMDRFREGPEVRG